MGSICATIYTCVSCSYCFPREHILDDSSLLFPNEYGYVFSNYTTPEDSENSEDSSPIYLTKEDITELYKER